MLIDSTLREGEQRYGVYFRPEQRQAMVRLALAAGLEELELGLAADPEQRARLHALATSLAGPGQAVSLWCRALQADIRAAAALRPARLSLCLPVSDAHIARKLGLDRAGLRRRLETSLELARGLGIAYVSVGLEDATRADRAFALDMAAAAQDMGASRVRLSDTVGLFSPTETAGLVAAFRRRLGIHLAVHCHNDFGLATANALAALEAGADFADATALGLGERAGLASLEQLAGFLALRRGAAYDLKAVGELCRTAAQCPAVRLDPHAPLVGERLFWAETGLHVDGLAKAPELYEPFDPKALGLDRRLAVGAKSGAAAVGHKLRQLGLQAAPQDILPEVRRLSRAKGRSLDDDEVQRLVE